MPIPQEAPRAPTEQQEYEVRCCGDPLLLGRWFDRALRAREAQEIFRDD